MSSGWGRHPRGRHRRIRESVLSDLNGDEACNPNLRIGEELPERGGAGLSPHVARGQAGGGAQGLLPCPRVPFDTSQSSMGHEASRSRNTCSKVNCLRWSDFRDLHTRGIGTTPHLPKASGDVSNDLYYLVRWKKPRTVGAFKTFDSHLRHMHEHTQVFPTYVLVFLKFASAHIRVVIWIPFFLSTIRGTSSAGRLSSARTWCRRPPCA